MQPGVVTCTKCRALFPSAWLNSPQLSPCPSCNELLRVEVFPALFRTFSSTNAEALLVENESSCFYHPQKKAIIPCDSCGRFLCALCDLDLSGQHICPACLETGKKKGKIKNLENTRTRYDSIAFRVAALPLLIGFWPSIVGAPIALYVAIRYRKHPCSIVQTRRILFPLAILLASVEIVGWTLFFIYLAKH